MQRRYVEEIGGALNRLLSNIPKKKKEEDCICAGCEGCGNWGYNQAIEKCFEWFVQELSNLAKWHKHPNKDNRCDICDFNIRIDDLIKRIKDEQMPDM